MSQQTEINALRERATFYGTEARDSPPEKPAEARETAERLRALADQLERDLLRRR